MPGHCVTSAVKILISLTADLCRYSSDNGRFTRFLPYSAPYLEPKNKPCSECTHLPQVMAYSAKDYGPGAVVYLTGGQMFTGTLELTSVDNGNSDFPVTIPPTGDKPEIINAGSDSAVVLDTVTDVLVENLVLVVAGRNNGNSADRMLINDSEIVSGNHIELSVFSTRGCVPTTQTI